MKTKTLYTVILITLAIVANLQARPAVIGQLYHFYDYITDALPDEDRLVMSTSGGGLQVIDFENPDAPRVTSSINSPGGHLARAGRFFLHASDYMLTCYSLSDNGNLERTGAAHLHGPYSYGNVASACAEDSVVFIYSYVEVGVEYSYGYFNLFKINNRGSLESAYQRREDMHNFGVSSMIQNHMLYLNNVHSEKFQVWDIEDPELPEIEIDMDRHLTPIFAKPFREFFVCYDHYRADRQNEYVIEIRIAPVVFSQIELQEPLRGSQQLDDNRLMLVSGNQGFIYDLSDQDNPVLETQYEAPDGNQIIEGDRLWQYDQTGVKLFDFSDPEHLQQVSEYSHLGSITSVAKDGAFLYLAANAGGIRVVYVSDPVDPAEVGSWNGDYLPTDFIPAGDWGVAKSDTSIMLFSISNGTVLIPAANIHGQFRKTIPFGNYLFAIGSNSRLTIFDCNDLADPVIVRTFEGLTIDIDVFEGRLYVMVRENIGQNPAWTMLSTYDLEMPSNPQLLGVDTLGTEYSFKIAPPFVHTLRSVSSERREGDYTNRYYYSLYKMIAVDSIRMIGEVDFDDVNYYFDSGSRILAVQDSTAFVWNSVDRELESIEYRRRSLHRHATGIRTANSVVLDGEIAYLAQYSSVGIYDFTEYLDVASAPQLSASNFHLYDCYPNPFNSSTTISFSVYGQSPHAIAGGVGGVSIRIYDLSGRLVTDLLGSAGVSAGTHKVVWEAIDQPAGVYLIRLQSGTQTSTRKIVLMR